jgi:hypothetical protein
MHNLYMVLSSCPTEAIEYQNLTEDNWYNPICTIDRDGNLERLGDDEYDWADEVMSTPKEKRWETALIVARRLIVSDLCWELKFLDESKLMEIPIPEIAPYVLKELNSCDLLEIGTNKLSRAMSILDQLGDTHGPFVSEFDPYIGARVFTDGTVELDDDEAFIMLFDMHT